MKKLIIFLIAIFAYSMPSIVNLDWLKKHFNDKDLVLIDVRDKKCFEKGHFLKAINWPRFEVLFDIKHNYLLPPLSFLQEYFSKAGINEKSKVVFYGTYDLSWPARGYWISLLLGHKNAAILGIGYEEAKKYLPTTTKIYQPQPSNFIPKLDTSILKTKLDVVLALHKAIIIDGRPPEYFKGLVSAKKRKGHIPGAINIPGRINYDKHKGIKSIEILEKLYPKLSKDKEIILYCQDGADAALNFIVLRLLGYKKVSVYDGGWFEWADDLNLPIER